MPRAGHPFRPHPFLASLCDFRIQSADLVELADQPLSNSPAQKEVGWGSSIFSTRAYDPHHSIRRRDAEETGDGRAWWVFSSSVIVEWGRNSGVGPHRETTQRLMGTPHTYTYIQCRGNRPEFKYIVREIPVYTGHRCIRQCCI